MHGKRKVICVHTCDVKRFVIFALILTAMPAVMPPALAQTPAATTTNQPTDIGLLFFQVGEATFAQARWREALEAFEKVPQGHAKYDTAQERLATIKAKMKEAAATSTNAAPVSTPGPVAIVEGVTFKGSVTIEQKAGEDDIRRSRSNILVWLTRPGLPPGKPVEGLKLEQKDKAFVPKLLVVPVGSTVDFPNSDSIFHNVFSLSKTNPFDLGLYKKPKSQQWKFEKPGLVDVFCNIHQDMVAYIYVMNSPYYAITNAEGVFEIQNVAPGTYALKGWHERAPKLFEQEVEVKAGGTDVTLTMTDDPELANKKHPRKDGTPYKNTSYGDDSGPGGY